MSFGFGFALPHWVSISGRAARISVVITPAGCLAVTVPSGTVSASVTAAGCLQIGNVS